MLINLSPVRIDGEEMVLEKRGNAIVVNGEVFDFSRMKDGESIPSTAIVSRWFYGGEFIDMVGGELVLTIVIPLPYNYSQEQAFPLPIHMTHDGIVPLPKPLPVSAMLESEEQVQSEVDNHE